VGPELIQNVYEKGELIRTYLVTTKSRKKFYSDKRRGPLEFTWEVMFTYFTNDEEFGNR
jgi:hypothetical protein